jgi:peptide deformylase
LFQVKQKTTASVEKTVTYQIPQKDSKTPNAKKSSAVAGLYTLRMGRASAFSVTSSTNLLASSSSVQCRSLASFQKAGRLARVQRSVRRPSMRSPPPPNTFWSWTQLLASINPSSSSIKEEVDPGAVPGTSLRIVKYPHPALRQPNALITKEELDSGKIAQLAKEMFLLMYAAEGVGLAAPQVGINQRLMVFNPTGDAKKWLDEVVLINPQIVERSTATDIETEGCLSFPDMNGDVERPKWIKVQALNGKGRTIKKKFSGWEARIFQHEYDHLDGVVYIDRLTEEGRKQVQPRLDTLIAEFGEGGAL